jgi:hypothetical protein
MQIHRKNPKQTQTNWRHSTAPQSEGVIIMKKKTNSFKALVTLNLALLVLLAPAVGSAQVIYMNFDSVDTSSGPVDATAYLNSFGITLTDVSPAGTALIWPSSTSGISWVQPSSTPNFLLQDAAGSPPCSYTLDFGTPLQSVSFTRVALDPSAACATPYWSATAYVGTTAVGSVGDSSLDAFTWAPAETYTLSGNGITSLVIWANGVNWTGIASAPLDDFYLTEVPEPSTATLLVLGIGAIGGGRILRRRSS